MESSPSVESPLEPLRTIVVKPHEANGDETQLELKVNDIVYVLEQDETGWWGGHKENEDFTGWFPGTCVRPQPQPQSSASGPLNGGTAAIDASTKCAEGNGSTTVGTSVPAGRGGATSGGAAGDSSGSAGGPRSNITAGTNDAPGYNCSKEPDS
jgi:hypothetical protein